MTVIGTKSRSSVGPVHSGMYSDINKYKSHCLWQQILEGTKTAFKGAKGVSTVTPAFFLCKNRLFKTIQPLSIEILQINNP